MTATVAKNAEDTCLKTQDVCGNTSIPAGSGEGRFDNIGTIDEKNATDAEGTSISKTGDGAEENKPTSQTPPEDDDDYFPEGGVQAWLVVFGSFSAMFMMFGIINSTGSLQAYLISNQLRENPPEQVAWIFSLNLFMVFFCGIYIGGVFDAHGSRQLVALGSFCLILSIMLLSLCTGRSSRLNFYPA